MPTIFITPTPNDEQKRAEENDRKAVQNKSETDAIINKTDNDTIKPFTPTPAESSSFESYIPVPTMSIEQ